MTLGSIIWQLPIYIFYVSMIWFYFNSDGKVLRDATKSHSVSYEAQKTPLESHI